ncbi:MAG: tRNA epoxyqueuosine(34) reductase QueG [Myxococcota bacterium]|nr:tRNA epoxyqueuosine(34) reductase QueG [Myxococcota bacterium]
MPSANITILESSEMMAASCVSFSDQVRDKARRLGFDAVGIARASHHLGQDFERYEAFIGDGMHGEMGWLARNADVRARLDGQGILAGAKSVVCVARRYQRPTEGRVSPQGIAEAEGSLPGVVENIARYARGRDYHRFLRRRLRRLAAFVRSLGTADRPVRARPLCDEEPILERAWASRAGLGFVGKNGMIIVPGQGSMVLLGEVVTTLDLDVDVPIQERCGTCTRCLDACPTRAFSSPFALDPRRCVSYLTIEQRSAVVPELREGIGTHLFGCDDCQTVCPFNAGGGARAALDARDGDPFAPLERWSHIELESLLSLEDASWRALFEGTPLRRAGRVGIARNAAIVLGNRGATRALPALRAAASGHDDPMVRDAAAWAVARIEGAGSP